MSVSEEEDDLEAMGTAAQQGDRAHARAVHCGWFRWHASCRVYFATIFKKIDFGTKRGFRFVM